MAEILPAIHAMVFFATLGVAGAKFSEWIRGPPSADGNSGETSLLLLLLLLSPPPPFPGTLTRHSDNTPHSAAQTWKLSSG
jgi:hypothetical protein